MDKTWFDVLTESSREEILDLFFQFVDHFDPISPIFTDCFDAFEWFRVRGLKCGIHCPGDTYSCADCFRKFLNFKVGHEDEGDF